MRNTDWTEREHQSLGSAMQRTSDPMYGPVFVRGQGSRVWDVEGRPYFDLLCGYSAANFGHAFAPLINVANAQLNTLTHFTGLSHPGRARLAELLIQHCGRPGDRVIFNTSGSRAIETAMKVAWSVRPGTIVSLAPGYHGRSLVTAMLSDTARGCSLPGPLWQQRPLHEFAYCPACPLQLTYPSCQLACQKTLLQWLTENHHAVSAVIVEPAVGARGYIAPPHEYWQRLRELTSRLGILMIADEIQMGLGRCGDWLLSRAQGWQADLVVLGKSLGGGLVPVSAVIGPSCFLDGLPQGCESETFAASPLAMAIGCEVIEQLSGGPWMRRGGQLGTALSRWLQAEFAHGPGSLKPLIETLGAAITVEFLSCYSDRSQAAAAARTWTAQLLSAGLLVHYTGPYATRVVLLPPLTMTEEELACVKVQLSAAVHRHVEASNSGLGQK